MRSNGLCPQSVFAAGGLLPVGFKRSWLSTSHHLLSSAMATRSECERKAPVGEDYPATELEHRLAEWLDRRAAALDTPPAKPQSPRQPIYLSVKRKASEQPEKPESKPEVTAFLLPRAAKLRDEDFMKNKAAPVFHSSNIVLVPCEFRRTGPGVSEAELLECYRVGDDKYQGKGCAWMAWRLVGQA